MQMNSDKTRNKDGETVPASSMGFGLIVRGIRRHPITLLFFLVLAGVGGAVIWLKLPLPKMTAYCVFQIKSQPDALPVPGAEGDGRIEFSIYRQSQSVLLKHHHVLSSALTQSEIGNLPMLKNESDKVLWLENQLKVDFKLGPEFMRLLIEGNDANQIKAIIEAVTDAYKNEVLNRDRTKRSARREMVENVITKKEEQKRVAQKRLAELTAKRDSSEASNLPSTEKTKYVQKIAIWESELIQNERSQATTTSALKAVEDKINNIGELPVSDGDVKSFLHKDSQYEKLAKAEETIRSEVDKLKESLAPGVVIPKLSAKQDALAIAEQAIKKYMTEKRPSIVKQLQANVGASEKLRKSELEFKLRSLVNERVEYKTKLAELEAKIAAIETKSKNPDPDQFLIESLNTTISREQKTLDALQQEKGALSIEIEPVNRVEIWEAPTVIPGIESNRRLKYSLIAVAALALMGLGLVTGLEYRNGRLNKAEEVSSGLGLRVIGTVPALPKKAFRSLNNDRSLAWSNRLAESVDSMRILMLHDLDGTRPIRTIMVTSAVNGEGKTSLAGHLSVSLARAGFKTLLIDADMRRPALHQVMGSPLTPGLSDLLGGEAEFDEVLRETPIHGLWLIPAGFWHHGVPRILSSNAWRDLKSRLESSFDYIIVDSTPILAVADALLLAKHIDGVLLSMLHDVSRLPPATEAKDRLTRVGANILGVIINGLTSEFADSPYVYAGADSSGVI
jgi:succinoglycan biosynthesis transport protein ExoP